MRLHVFSIVKTILLLMTDACVLDNQLTYIIYYVAFKCPFPEYMHEEE